MSHADHTIAADIVQQFNQLSSRSLHAGVVELADTPALGAGGPRPWGFESLRPHAWKQGFLAPDRSDAGTTGTTRGYQVGWSRDGSVRAGRAHPANPDPPL